AAKNFKFVTTVVNPDDYEEVIRRIENNELDENYRKSLMIKVFKHTNDYDNTIVEFFNDASEELRYGENPQQNATFV
ncbi:bifunctional phosphoribosylaminoimidazolecarboxamide formyltransferase/IMP cyclohydrolase, partial [Staphylococcus aureus]|nr:bifunctional phosphoribosylaminoimidazolecarboxamide formyltransferase/IMP cyclohydrolase [Staphylococcus aureus]